MKIGDAEESKIRLYINIGSIFSFIFFHFFFFFFLIQIDGEESTRDKKEEWPVTSVNKCQKENPSVWCRLGLP